MAHSIQFCFLPLQSYKEHHSARCTPSLHLGSCSCHPSWDPAMKEEVSTTSNLTRTPGWKKLPSTRACFCPCIWRLWKIADMLTHSLDQWPSRPNHLRGSHWTGITQGTIAAKALLFTQQVSEWARCILLVLDEGWRFFPHTYLGNFGEVALAQPHYAAQICEQRLEPSALDHW